MGWYAKIYEGASPTQLLIDGSTGYTRYPEVPNTVERLYAHAPDAKLIYLMRDPVERAYSHYIHRWTKELHWNEPFRVPFEEHIKTDTMCINSSDYRLQIEQYLKRYHEDSLLCLFSHELKADREKVLRRVCEFLGMEYSPDFFPTPEGRDNDSAGFLESRVRDQIVGRLKSIPFMSTASKIVPGSLRESVYRMIRRSSLSKNAEASFAPPPMLPHTRSALIERFRDSNRWVESFTGTNLECWEKN